MTIVILANNPVFIKENQSIINKYIDLSDIMVSIKFKYADIFIDRDLKKHDIYFRVNNQNFIFGLNDYYHEMINKLHSTTSLFLVSNINKGENQVFDFEKHPEINFRSFEYESILSYLLNFENTSIFKKLEKILFLEGCIDTNKLSTGFLVILKYYLQFPEAKIILLGYYEEGNQVVLKEGKRLSLSSHQFQDERIILNHIAPEILFIN